MARKDPQFMLRLTAELKENIKQEAEKQGRSMNAEISARLETSFLSQLSGVEQITADQALLLSEKGFNDAPDAILAICFKEISRNAKLGRKRVQVDIEEIYKTKLRMLPDSHIDTIMLSTVIPKVVSKLESLGYEAHYYEEELMLIISFSANS